MRTIISLGGSVVYPDGINIDFLRRFRQFVLAETRQGKSFAITVGGGKLCRDFQKAAGKLGKPSTDELHWLGINSNRLNALLLRTIIGKQATVIDKLKRSNSKVIIAYGQEPGCSTDYVAVMLAKQYKAGTIYNMTDVPYVYDRNPALAGAKPFSKISWKAYRKMFPVQHEPGGHIPFDAVASREAEKAGIKVIILSSDLKNIQACLEGKHFIGTVIT